MTGKSNEFTLEQLLMSDMDEVQIGAVGADEAKETPETDTTNEVDLNAALEAALTQEQEEEKITPEHKKEESKKKTPEESPDSTVKNKDESKTPYPIAFARYQLEQGNLRALDEEELLKVIEEDGEEAGMAFIQNKESEAIRNEILETYEEDVQYYLDLLDSGVDRDSAKAITKNRVKYEKISKDDIENEDNEDLRKDVLRTHYMLTTKFSDAKIEKLIEKSVVTGDDIEEATEAIEEINRYFKDAGEQQKQIVAEQDKVNREKQQKELKDLSDKIENLTEVVPGFSLTKVDKNKIKDIITKPVKEMNGVPLNAMWAKRAEDPFKFDTVMATLFHYGVFEGKWDKLVKGTKSKAAEELRRSISQDTSFKTRTTSSNNDVSDQEKDSLSSLKRAFGY